MLLEADADINHVTSSGTCLHEAALYGKTDVVKSLLEVSLIKSASGSLQFVSQLHSRLFLFFFPK